MANDLETMSRKELLELRANIDTALVKAETREKAEALKAAERAVAEFGFSLYEVAPGGKTRGVGKQTISPPKYRNPQNPEQTWIGRGRKPQWVHDALQRGDDISDLEI